MPFDNKIEISSWRVSQIIINLPFGKRLVVVDNISTHKRIKQLRKRLEKKPDDIDSRLSLAYLLAVEGFNKEALSEWIKAHLELPFDESVQGDPALSQKNSWAHYIYGLILNNTGALEEAKNEWVKASALDRYGVGKMAKDKLNEVFQI